MQDFHEGKQYLESWAALFKCVINPRVHLRV